MIRDFVKETLGIEEDASVERAGRTRKLYNTMAQEIKRTIIMKFLNFKGKSRILNTCREKSYGRGNLCKSGIFRGDTHQA